MPKPWKLAKSLTKLREQINAAANCILPTFEAISLSDTCAAFTRIIRPAIFHLYLTNQILTRVWMSLRAMCSIASSIVFSVFRIIRFTTFLASKSAFSVSAKAVNKLTDSYELVTVFTESGSVNFRRWSRLCRNYRERLGFRWYVENNFQITAPTIFLNRYRLKVIVTDAVPNSAKMVNFEVRRYLANLILVCKAMRSGLCPSATVLDSKGAVTVIAGATYPKPTTIFALNHSAPKPPPFRMNIHRGIITHAEVFHCA